MVSFVPQTKAIGPSRVSLKLNSALVSRWASDANSNNGLLLSFQLADGKSAASVSISSSSMNASWSSVPHCG